MMSSKALPGGPIGPVETVVSTIHLERLVRVGNLSPMQVSVALGRAGSPTSPKIVRQWLRTRKAANHDKPFTIATILAILKGLSKGDI
jgi:hypothetical protein